MGINLCPFEYIIGFWFSKYLISGISNSIIAGR